MLIAVVAVVAVIGAYWMLILSPKREEAVKLDGADHQAAERARDG